jgi:hypothetical protein
MDEVVDSLIQEISETVTNPDVTAWFTCSGYEVGDLCKFIYGPTFLAPNGSHANHTFGSRKLSGAGNLVDGRPRRLFARPLRAFCTQNVLGHFRAAWKTRRI